MQNLQYPISHIDLEPFLEKLEKLFLGMSAKYDEVASHYGFECRGCDDNCCMTLFHHHTYLEYFYLKKGFETLPKELKTAIYERAVRAVKIAFGRDKIDDQPSSHRSMCPANMNGRCTIYHYRPMICRLHGVPSEWSFPANSGKHRTVISSGCEEFSRQVTKSHYYKFDRTPFYSQLASLERQLKEHFGLHSKIKKTVAEIIVCETPVINMKSET